MFEASIALDFISLLLTETMDLSTSFKVLFSQNTYKPAHKKVSLLTLKAYHSTLISVILLPI